MVAELCVWHSSLVLPAKLFSPFPLPLAMAAPTPQELAQQVISLANEVQQLKAVVETLKQTQSKKDNAWNGLLDRKYMLPEKFLKREDWK